MRYRFEDYALDTERRELRRGTDLVSLEPQVFDLLEYLLRNRERVASKDDLIAAIWGGRTVSDSALSTRINAARLAVRDSGEKQRLIRTWPKKGIRFVGTVREDRNISEGSTQRMSDLLDRPSIAVLPFANMSGDSDQDYFSDGVADEIITALSCCNWLFVIARTSSFTYRGKPVDVRQVGRELNVRYVLEGSVRRSGNRLRFTGQLIDATSGAHIWADRFDGEMHDIFEIQDSFTASVVAAIEPRLQLAEIERLKLKPAANLDAYDLLLRAQQHIYEFTEGSLREALRSLNEALAIDEAYAPAMAAAAYCYAQLYNCGWVTEVEAEATQGLRLAARSVEIGKDDSNVLWMAAFAVWLLEGNPRRAKNLVYRSVQRNPNSAIALALAGWVESTLGNLDKAFEFIERARLLSPRDPREWFASTAMAAACLESGKFEEAVAWAESAMAQNPRFNTARRICAAGLARLGQLDEAVALLRRALEAEPHLTLSKLRKRLRHMDRSVWDHYQEALRLAGFPE